MSGWELALPVAEPDGSPVFLRIARAVIDDVRRGRLAPGDELPGSRTLAGSLGVHRNTVLSAYRELSAEGWITTSQARGTFVSAELPDPSPRRKARASARAEVPARIGFDVRGGSPPPYAQLPDARAAEPARCVLSMAGGQPDLRLVPVEALARAYRRALRSSGRALLDYGDPRGHERLREALAAMLAAVRGLAATAETVLVTRGSQMALDLVARGLFAPGDVVGVEALGYRPAWEALRLAGARLVPIPVDASGVSVEHLRELAARERVRGVYVTPHHQYPTTAVLSPGRRIELLELARRERFAILEDDYDHEFHYDGRPVLPIASADAAGVVVYIGTLSKILAPGLRIGFVVAPAPLLERLAALRTYVDRQGDLAVERAVAELLEDGEVQRHARRMRKAYTARRTALVEALGGHLGEALSFHVPPGGMALWARAARGIDAGDWALAAAREGVVVHPAQRFTFDGRPRPFLRLGFGCLTEAEIREAVRRLARALTA